MKMRAPIGCGIEGRRLPWRTVVLASLLWLQGCTTMPQVVRLEEGDSARGIELKQGQLLEIRLIHPGMGMSIMLGSVVAPVLAQVGQPTLRDDTVRDGVSGTGNYESWVFRAVQPGSVAVRMDFRMQWETIGTPSRSVTYQVAVQ